MSKSVRIILIVVLVLGLVAVRLFQGELFYDPLITFFNLEYYAMDFPELQTGKLLAYTAVRYALNTVLSLAILFLVFRSKTTVALSLYIYIAVFVLLFGLFWYLVATQSTAYNFLFYTRRFLIQPLLLLLLLPAFYYHKKAQ